jgi:hypothetical protein
MMLVRRLSKTILCLSVTLEERDFVALRIILWRAAWKPEYVNQSDVHC